MEINIEKMKTIGQEWIKDQHHRIYFNDLEELGGFVIHRYKTGNISSASFNGEKISNSKARKILPDSFSKLWYDVKTGQFQSKGVDSEVFEVAVQNILEQCQ